MINEFHDWLNTAREGDYYVYHKGYLIRDRKIDPADSTRVQGAKREISVLAEMILRLMEKGQVLLVQYRRGYMDYDYIAVKYGETK